ncbi:MAG: hypothetical protein ACODAA_01025 [Gemmatimonadota bacterium]
MINRTLAVATLFLLGGFVPLAAQQSADAVHSGFWLTGGLGVGVTDEGSSGDDAGPAFYLRMGGTPSERVLLGGEAIGFTRDVGGADVTLGNATFSVLYYPASPGGMFVKAGAGFASATVSTDVAGGTFTSDDQGFGLTFGGGYDVRIGENLYLTPNVDVMIQSFDEFADANSFLFTLGIGFH